MKNKELKDCEMSVRLSNILRAAQLETFEDVLNEGSSRLLKYRHFGFKSLHELRQILLDNGFELKQ